MNNQYIITVRYYFYTSTLNTPKNGWVNSKWDGLIIFDSRKKAEKYIIENLPGGNRTQIYYTAHGEYSRPTYNVRKLPKNHPMYLS